MTASSPVRGFALAEIAAATGARLEGDGTLALTRVAHPAEAGPDALALAADAAHVAALAQGRARAALLAEGTDWRALGLEGALIAARPRHALASLTRLFARPHGVAPGVHPTAVVDPTAEIAPDACVGPLCVVGPGARIGARAALVAQVYVGAEARIGADGLLHPGARVLAGVAVGDRAIIHANAVIGADGFSFVTPSRGAARNMRLERIHSLGAVTLGDDVEVGAGATIDRGTLADTRIADGAKIDNLVQIGHNVRVGANAMLCAQTGIAGSSTIGARVVLAGQTGVGDHVKIGDDVVAGGQSGIGADIPAGTVVLGSPAMPKREAITIMMAWRRLPGLIEAVRALKKRLPEEPGKD